MTADSRTLDQKQSGLVKVGDKSISNEVWMVNGRLDGHIVQGPVDQTARCTAVEEADGSWYYTFVYDFDKKKAREGYMTVGERIGNGKRCEPYGLQF